METELRPEQSVYVIGEVGDDFPVTVIRPAGRCLYCGLPSYRCRTPARQELILCRSSILLPN